LAGSRISPSVDQTAVSSVKIGTDPTVTVILTAGKKMFEQTPSGFDGRREKLRIIAPP